MAFADPRVWPEKDAAQYARYIDRLAQTVRASVRLGHEVHLFSTDGPDRGTVRELGEKVGEESRSGRVIAHDTTTVEDLLALLVQLDVVVASRLHGVILAMVAARPVLAISYDRKVDRVMQDFDLQHFTTPISTFEPEAVVALLPRALDQRHAIEARLTEQVGVYRARLQEQYARVLGLVGSRV
jgi:polysaccharide pyruvyl transferase WcaK-like protein